MVKIRSEKLNLEVFVELSREREGCGHYFYVPRFPSFLIGSFSFLFQTIFQYSSFYSHRRGTLFSFACKMSGKGAKGLIMGKSAANNKDKDKKKPVSRSSRAGLQVSLSFFTLLHLFFRLPFLGPLWICVSFASFRFMPLFSPTNPRFLKI